MTGGDHFSEGAEGYRRYRPRYPDALFAFLADGAPTRRLAWDCACGSGQATGALARHFEAVVGTDLSARQLAQAEPCAGVHYAVALAGASGLPTGAVDLVSVAQAWHWFAGPAFDAEVRRVLAPGGILAIWCYGLLNVSAEVDAVLAHLYRDVVGPYWPAERTHVDSAYARLPFPFPRIEAPGFRMEACWTLQDLLGYLGTWSATRRHDAATGGDAVGEVCDELTRAWGPELEQTISWPLSVHVGRAP